MKTNLLYVLPVVVLGGCAPMVAGNALIEVALNAKSTIDRSIEVRKLEDERKVWNIENETCSKPNWDRITRKYDLGKGYPTLMPIDAAKFYKGMYPEYRDFDIRDGYNENLTRCDIDGVVTYYTRMYPNLVINDEFQKFAFFSGETDSRKFANWSRAQTLASVEVNK